LQKETLRQLGEQIPRRDGKLANAIKNKGLGKEATATAILYAIRKKADYEAGVIREEAELAVKLSMEVHKLLERYP
jgi:hypothetical protein